MNQQDKQFNETNPHFQQMIAGLSGLANNLQSGLEAMLKDAPPEMRKKLEAEMKGINGAEFEKKLSETFSEGAKKINIQNMFSEMLNKVSSEIQGKNVTGKMDELRKAMEKFKQEQAAKNSK